MPAALILICPSPGSVSGTPAHFSISGGPYPVITIALGMAVPFWWRPRYGRAGQLQRVRWALFRTPSIAPGDGADAFRPWPRVAHPGLRPDADAAGPGVAGPPGEPRGRAAIAPGMATILTGRPP